MQEDFLNIPPPEMLGKPAFLRTESNRLSGIRQASCTLSIPLMEMPYITMLSLLSLSTSLRVASSTAEAAKAVPGKT